jgi:hypothetical protein
MPKVPSVELAELKTDKDKAEKPNIEETKTLEILSPSSEVIVPRAQKSSAATRNSEETRGEGWQMY